MIAGSPAPDLFQVVPKKDLMRTHCAKGRLHNDIIFPRLLTPLNSKKWVLGTSLPLALQSVFFPLLERRETPLENTE